MEKDSPPQKKKNSIQIFKIYFFFKRARVIFRQDVLPPIISISQKPGVPLRFMDLGCGSGEILRDVYKVFEGGLIGVEINKALYW